MLTQDATCVDSVTMCMLASVGPSCTAPQNSGSDTSAQCFEGKVKANVHYVHPTIPRRQTGRKYAIDIKNTFALRLNVSNIAKH
jgi:hypothetical protein